MESKLYVIYDQIAEEYGPLFEAVNDAVASRSAAIALRQANPSDFEMWCIGRRQDIQVKDGFLGEQKIVRIDSLSSDFPYLVEMVIKKSADNNLSVVEVKNHESSI